MATQKNPWTLRQLVWDWVALINVVRGREKEAKLNRSRWLLPPFPYLETPFTELSSLAFIKEDHQVPQATTEGVIRQQQKKSLYYSNKQL